MCVSGGGGGVILFILFVKNNSVIFPAIKYFLLKLQ